MIGIEKKRFSKNNWPAKLKRTSTSILLVDNRRKGKCNRCGACCKLPNPCPFLRIDELGMCVCKIYRLRPLNCRKYPRAESELFTAETCGYSFDKTND